MSEIKITDDTTTIPDGVKKPQDRRAKIDKDGSRTVTVRGLTVTVPLEVMDDFELLDDLNAMDNDEPQALPSILRRVLGKEHFKEAMRILRDPATGRVSITDGAEFVGELFKALDPNS